MSNLIYDKIIVGGGPIGSATAYFLSKNIQNEKILVLTKEPTEDHTPTYLFAGGSINSYWEDDLKRKMTTMTSEFIRGLISEGVDLASVQDNYFFVELGIFVPSLNVSGSKLVNYFLAKAQEKGIEVKNNATLEKVEQTGEVYTLKTNNGSYQAKKVLLSVGNQIKNFIPEIDVVFEKRQLYVMDVKIDDSNRALPHTILRLKHGEIYFFIKKINDEYKLVVGQEDLFENNEEWEEENNYAKLLELGLTDLLPFLKNAKVEKILWGFDAFKKIPNIHTTDDKLFAVNCGSAVRSCVYIGQEVVKKLI